MLSKRRRDDESDDEDDSVDIFAALTSKRRRSESEDDDDNDDELGEFIRTSIAKRDIKQGTEVVKKAKGKGKLVKGEVGGGSFQSMGASQCFALLDANFSCNMQVFTHRC